MDFSSWTIEFRLSESQKNPHFLSLSFYSFSSLSLLLALPFLFSFYPLLLIHRIFLLSLVCSHYGDPRARLNPNDGSEPKPRGRPFNSFILHFIKFYFSKVSRPESSARPEWRIRIGARFTPTILFILLKRLINLFSCGSGFSFGQAHNHLQISSNSVDP